MTDLSKDILYALRGLRRSPGYAAVTILTLALGIGANTAIFSVVHGVLLRPLSYPEPERLVFVTSQFPTLGFDKFWISVPEYLELKKRNQSFTGVGGYREGAVNIGGYDRPRRVNSAIVTPELLDVLGVSPKVGRLFVPPDAAPGAEDVAIISDNLWRTDFGSDPQLVGKMVQIDGQKMRVVAIMPAGFDLHDERIDVWLPIGLNPASLPGRSGHFLYLVGRLKESYVPSRSATRVDPMIVLRED